MLCCCMGQSCGCSRSAGERRLKGGAACGAEGRSGGTIVSEEERSSGVVAREEWNDVAAVWCKVMGDDELNGDKMVMGLLVGWPYLLLAIFSPFFSSLICFLRYVLIIA